MRKNKNPRRHSPLSSKKKSGIVRLPAETAQESKSKPTSKQAKSGPLFPRHLRAVVGTHAISEVLNVRAKAIEYAWVKQGHESSQELRDLVKELQVKKIKIEFCSENLLEKLAHSNQGAALFVNERPELELEDLAKQQKAQLLLLDGIEDPHNLGAILRTAWLLGVQGIILPQDRSVNLTPAVHKVACGGAEHVPLLTVANFSNTLESLKKNGFWVLGLSHRGAKDLFQQSLPDKVIWAVGAEDRGLRTTTEKLCDELVKIPQMAASASYNASVAAAIALSEGYRQQKQQS